MTALNIAAGVLRSSFSNSFKNQFLLSYQKSLNDLTEEEFFAKADNAITHMIYNQDTEILKKFVPVIDLLLQGDTVCAVMLAEANGWSADLLSEVKKIFRVLPW